MKNIIFIIILGLHGCAYNRSISYSNHGYNPSYQGEISQIGFLKDISGNDRLDGGEQIKINPDDYVAIIQSGQMMPDEELIQLLPKNLRYMPISGIVSNESSETGLRKALSAGGIDKALAYWGNIRRTPSDMLAIRCSVIIADLKEGIWREYAFETEAVEAADAFWDFNQRKVENRQFSKLKSELYQKMVNTIINQ